MLLFGAAVVAVLVALVDVRLADSLEVREADELLEAEELDALELDADELDEARLDALEELEAVDETTELTAVAPAIENWSEKL